MKLLMDTDICIYLINKKSPFLIDRLKTFKTGEVGVSSMTYAELVFGAYNSLKVEQNLIALREFFLPLNIVPFDDHAGFTYGQIKAQLKKTGALVGPMDLLIGSHAVSIQIPLMTNNEKDFRKIPGIQIMNWTQRGV